MFQLRLIVLTGMTWSLDNRQTGPLSLVEDGVATPALQRKARNALECFGCLGLYLYCIRELASATHRTWIGPVWTAGEAVASPGRVQLKTILQCSGGEILKIPWTWLRCYCGSLADQRCITVEQDGWWSSGRYLFKLERAGLLFIKLTNK